MICRLLLCFETDFCELVGIRTPNLLIRSEVLYPVELQVQYLNWTAKIGGTDYLSKLYSEKIDCIFFKIFICLENQAFSFVKKTLSLRLHRCSD